MCLLERKGGSGRVILQEDGHGVFRDDLSHSDFVVMGELSELDGVLDRNRSDLETGIPDERDVGGSVPIDRQSGLHRNPLRGVGAPRTHGQYGRERPFPFVLYHSHPRQRNPCTRRGGTCLHGMAPPLLIGVTSRASPVRSAQ